MAILYWWYSTGVLFMICATVSFQVVYFELFSTEVQIFAILLCWKQSLKHSCMQVHMPSFTRPLPYQSTHRKYFSKDLISGCTFYIFFEDIKIRFQEPILKLRFFNYLLWKCYENTVNPIPRFKWDINQGQEQDCFNSFFF